MQIQTVFPIIWTTVSMEIKDSPPYDRFKHLLRVWAPRIHFSAESSLMFDKPKWGRIALLEGMFALEQK